jgi:coenzyme F420-reducing hydrogenase delta subunit/NAD-dependent dihydropyrimidine dehydrogenase PreA subunit
VSPRDCNGCGRCFEDCPYAAVVIDPRPDGRGGLARVLEDQCASCGICAGACPSSTPFRSAERIVTGIDLPHAPIDSLRQALDRRLPALEGATPVVVFGCRHGARVASLGAPDTATFELECAGMLAPSFVEYALRAGAHGVLVVGCREGECEFRTGMEIVRQRLAGVREPHLRANVPQAAVRIAARAAGEEALLDADLHALRRGLATASRRAAGFTRRSTTKGRRSHA